MKKPVERYAVVERNWTLKLKAGASDGFEGVAQFAGLSE